MLKTLIVDDEKLVRSELKKLTDWSKFNIKIVGEANNGNEALQFLANEPVDLMISDLSMPGLSGIEFLNVVRKRFPQVKIVVMTMHKDFGLVQKALRIGAIDYITKTQIEKSNFDSILRNILKRISSAPGEKKCIADEVSVYWHFAPSNLSLEKQFHKLDEDIYIGPIQKNILLSKNVINLQFSEVLGVSYRELAARVHKCISTELFYEFEPDKYVYSFCFTQEKIPHAKYREDVEVIFKGNSWVLDDMPYKKIRNMIPDIRMTSEELKVFLFQPYLTCASYFHWEPASYFEQTANFLWWFQWKEWLDMLRDKTAASLCTEDSSTFAIQKAITFIDRHFTDNITLDSILKIAAISKSRFSTLFKKKTGYTYINYLKRLRIKEAKKLLVNTNQPVYLIGEKVGYSNERYFRRVFLENTNYTPVQFRKMNMKK